MSETNPTSLVEYMVRPLVAHPDDVMVNVVEGQSSVLYELRVHADDVDAVKGNDGYLLAAMQQLVAVASGPVKPALDLIESTAASAEE